MTFNSFLSSCVASSYSFPCSHISQKERGIALFSIATLCGAFVSGLAREKQERIFQSGHPLGTRIFYLSECGREESSARGKNIAKPEPKVKTKAWRQEEKEDWKFGKLCKQRKHFGDSKTNLVLDVSSRTRLFVLSLKFMTSTARHISNPPLFCQLNYILTHSTGIGFIRFSPRHHIFCSVCESLMESNRSWSVGRDFHRSCY